MCIDFKRSPCELKHGGCHRPNCKYRFYDVSKICRDYHHLPYCKRILLECALRKSLTTEDQKVSDVWRSTVDELLKQCCKSKPKSGKVTGSKPTESDSTSNSGGSQVAESIMFHPGRVVLQDFTGVAALVDLAALRDAVETNVDDLSSVDSQCPADLVVDNFAQAIFNFLFKIIQIDFY